VSPTSAVDGQGFHNPGHTLSGRIELLTQARWGGGGLRPPGGGGGGNAGTKILYLIG
jgi:hypothetical protein